MINLKLGETHSIELISNPSTGYSWTVSPEKSKIISISESSVDVNPKDIGANHKTIFTIKGLKKGIQEIVFTYHKAWEKDIEPALTKSIIIKIN
jgi:predicted secreted protein